MGVAKIDDNMVYLVFFCQHLYYYKSHGPQMIQMRNKQGPIIQIKPI